MYLLFRGEGDKSVSDAPLLVLVILGIPLVLVVLVVLLLPVLSSLLPLRPPTVRLGSTNYFFLFSFLCLIWRVIKRYV